MEKRGVVDDNTPQPKGPDGGGHPGDSHSGDTTQHKGGPAKAAADKLTDAAAAALRDRPASP